MDKRIRIGAVSYLNTIPLLFGIKRSGLMDKIALFEEYPSLIAKMLLNDDIDLGLVPVAILPMLKEAHILTDFCIGTEGEVASVAIFSEVPMKEIKKVILDYQSKTSVSLAKILLKEYWQVDVAFEDAQEDFRSKILGTTAGLVIGDRALEQRTISRYTFDLGIGWKALTGLPFVFAVWVANKEMGIEFEDAFNRANGYGVSHMEEVLKKNKNSVYDLKKYYTQNISYLLNNEKKQGMAVFLEKLKTI